MLGFTTLKNNRISENAYADTKVQAIFESANKEVNGILASHIEDNAMDLPEKEVVSESAIEIPEESAKTLDSVMAREENVIEQEDLKASVRAETPSERIPLPETTAITVASEVTRNEPIILSYEEICESYYLQMENLKQMSELALDDLIENAKVEYTNTPVEVRQTLEYKSRMAAKYFELVGALEEMVDRAVADTLSDMRDKLLSYDYDVSIVEKMGTEYQATKAIRKNEILSEILTKTQEST